VLGDEDSSRADPKKKLGVLDRSLSEAENKRPTLFLCAILRS
jgi:hypothetical protein